MLASLEKAGYEYPMAIQEGLMTHIANLPSSWPGLTLLHAHIAQGGVG